MTENYPELQQLLAGYFNQDWVDEYKTADEVIQGFISESSYERTEKAQQELESLLRSHKSEQELQDFLFFTMGCSYYYPHEWPSGRLWLEHVSKKLELFLANEKH
ncbi:hypothetical protein HZF02_10780 [Pseudomonas yamanorum]|nr:hypothetical protein HZF02_10780 [Pseudomonas yamanorum]